MDCEVTGCGYRTRAGLTSFDQQFQQIRLHITMAHPDLREVMDISAASNHVTNPYSSRAEKLPRPTITEDTTEADWNFFEESWSRYKRSTGLEGQNIIDQLWACASNSLAKACYQTGAKTTRTDSSMW